MHHSVKQDGQSQDYGLPDTGRRLYGEVDFLKGDVDFLKGEVGFNGVVRIGWRLWDGS